MPYYKMLGKWKEGSVVVIILALLQYIMKIHNDAHVSILIMHNIYIYIFI